MPSPILRLALGAAAFGAAVTVAVAAQTAETARPSWRITDLGVVSGTTASQAFGVSSDGATVVGRALGTRSNPAVSWSATTGRLALPNLPGRSYAAANAVNAAGVVAGTSTTTVFGSGPLPVTWTNGVVTPLPLPAGQTIGRANAINAAGVVVGSVNGGSAEVAAVYAEGHARIVDLTTAGGAYMAYAQGISDSGLVVGSGIDPFDAARNVGLLLDLRRGTLVEIGALPGADGALAFGISPQGEYVVGSSMAGQGSGLPFVWTAAGGMVAIPLPPGAELGSAWAVNDRGWVVGNAGGLYSVPFLYADGRTVPIAALVPPGSGWNFRTTTSASAMGITNAGTIVGTAEHDGATHAYRLDPVQR